MKCNFMAKLDNTMIVPDVIVDPDYISSATVIEKIPCQKENAENFELPKQLSSMASVARSRSRVEGQVGSGFLKLDTLGDYVQLYCFLIVDRFH